ncbi:MAG: hypothetical protein KC646_04535 [Candidatus Cloacimonetes bacterium]|nr:hypothetical protein [Candidatus Cloacimonadota bacterium]
MDVKDRLALLEKISDKRWHNNLLTRVNKPSSLSNDKVEKQSLVEILQVFAKPQTWVTLYRVARYYIPSVLLWGALIISPLVAYRVISDPTPFTGEEYFDVFEFSLLVGIVFHHFFITPKQTIQSDSTNSDQISQEDATNPHQILIPDQSFVQFFDTEVKKSISARSKQCDVDIEAVNLALSELKLNLTNTLDPETNKELQNQAYEMEQSKIESLQIQSLITKSDNLFNSDQEKIEVLKHFLNLNRK